MSDANEVSANLSYLFAAYAVVWVGLFAYLFALMRRTQHLQREIEELRTLLARSKS